jgi:glycerophosphoryl diester phosphodiesterase
MGHRTTSLLLCLALLGACRKEELDIQNLNGGEILALGHGGMGIGSTYPLDSPASLLMCLNSGGDGTELDVQLTRDSVLVAYHSPDLSEGTTMSGRVWDHTWAELQEARFTGVPYTDHHLLSLEHFFTQVDVRDRAVSLDIKLNASGTPDAIYYGVYVNALLRLLDRGLFGDRLYIESQSPEFLAMLQARRPTLKLFIYPPDFATGITVARSLGLYGISIDMNKVTADQVSTAHAEGYWVAVWNAISKADNADAIRLNPEIIQTDRLDHLVGLLDP